MRLVTNNLHQVVLGERSSQKGNFMSEEMVQANHEEIKPPKQEVDFAAYESMRNDMHKFKRQLLDVEREKAEYAQKLKDLEDKTLENSENYKGLWEKTKAEAEQWQSKYTGLNKQIIENEKRKAIVEHAVKAGIRKDMVDLLDAFDTSEVLVETTDKGKFIVNGADTWINSLRVERPGLFDDFKKSDPKVNNRTGNFDGREKTYSHAELLELQKTDYKKYEDVIKNKRHLIVK